MKKNESFELKQYVAPQMSVFELAYQRPILQEQSAVDVEVEDNTTP